MSEEKKVAPKKATPKKEEKKVMVAKANSEIFLVGQEVEVEKVKFLVKEVKGIDIILSRKDYK